MCDSIANGGPRSVAEKCCPPANVIIASNVLSTNGNVIAGNIIAVDGTFTGNLHVAGNIVSNISYSSLNVAGPINGASIWGTSFFGNGNGLSNLNASNLTGTISNTNLGVTGVTPGTYGSSANVSQVTVDQYGRVTTASNIGILSSQWSTVAGNVAYQNGVSIGTLSAPPAGSNLYVLGSANITDVLNVSTLYVNSATVFGSATLNVFGISNLNSVTASLYIGNGLGLSNLNSSNLVGNVAAANIATSVTNPSQQNITSVGTLTGLTIQGFLVASNGSGISNLNSSNLVGNVAAANVASSVTNPSQLNITSVGILTTLNVSGISNLNSIVTNFISGNGSGLTNVNASNLIGNVAAANVASSVTNPSQLNITSVGTLTSLNVSGISNLNSIVTSLITGNGSGLTNVNASNLVGNVAAANVASSVTNPSQPNITSVGTLTSLTVSGIFISNLITGNGSGISNINGANVVSTVGTAQSVTNAAQPNITSVGILSSLSVTGSIIGGTISGDGAGITDIHPSAITGTVATANSVVQPAQPNITSVGTLTGLTVSGLLVVSNGSGISNINGANVVSTVGTAQSVTAAAQLNITSVGILTSLNVSGISNLNLISGNGSGISNINSSNLTGTISTGNFPTSGVSAGLYGSGANVSSVTVDQYGRITNATNVAITASQWTSNTGNTIYYANYVGIGDTFVPSATLHVIGNAYVSNSVTTTNIFFTNSILDTNLPTTSVSPGGYGSVANIPQIVVDQYGRLTSASNISFTATSQWTSVDANVAFGNGVSIGSLSNPPVGSNLYVFGNANIGTINTLSANIGTLVVPTQFNVVSANILTGNVTTSNIVTANIGTINVAGSANLVNLRVGTLANLVSANVTTANIVTLNVSGSANLVNLRVGTLANLVSANVTTANIVTLNVSTAANVTNLTVRTLANLVSANVTTANVATGNVVTANIVTLNVSTAANVTNLTVGTLANIATLNAFSIFGTNSNLVTANITTGNILTLNASSIFGTNSNLVTANITTGNILTLNASSIFGTNSNLVTANIETGNVVTLNASSIFGTNSNLVTANIETGNVVTLNASSIFGTNSNLVTANIGTGNVVTLNAFSILGTNSNLVTANIGTGNVVTLNASSIFGTNSNLVTANIETGNILTLNASSILGTNSNLVTANVGTANILTLNAFSILGTNSNLVTANIGTANILTLNAFSILGTNSNLVTANIGTGNVVTLNAFSIFGTTLSITNQANIFSSNLVTANVGTLNTQFLTVTSNILPGTGDGNTYLEGNIIVSGNVFSSLGMPLGSGGGYYLSLPADIALQVPYTGALYGATYPLSVGLSNGFTINGTSTLITVTPNGNFQFGVAGPYLLRAVFNSSDNIKGLAVGSNVADIHGTDQGYMHRYTTFITQNPTELIEIPFNVTDVSKYYYLDLFSVDGGTLRQTANTSGGTYLTITPLTGGGLATGGPGGTPGTQWISSGSNIYYSNSVGIGAVNPQYNLDVSTGTTASKFILVSNVSSLGGPTLNITSNVQISANLAVGGAIPFVSPPYALYVQGQGYFSEHVSYDNFAGYRNRLINGTFRVASRANSLTVSNTSVFSLSNAFVMDRWFVDSGNLSTSNVSMTIKQDAPIGQTNGFSNVANVYVTRAFGATLDNTWICPLVQTVEASGVYDLRLGQSTAKPIVLSFYANAAVTGNYSVVLRSKADNTYFANLVTLTNSWNRYTVYVPACTIGTWGTGVNGSIEVCLFGVSFGTGRANVAPTVSWTASPGYAPMAVTGAVNWMTSAPSRLQVTGVQLEHGTITTPFEIRLLSETVRLCQRYYETNTDIQYAAALGSGRVNSIPFVVTKRNHANVSVYRDLSNLTANTNVSQFVAYYGDGTLKGTQAINSYIKSEYGFSFNFTNTGSKFMDNSIMEAQFVWKADAEIY